MKTKKLRNWTIGFILLIILNIGIAFSYNGFVAAKHACVDNDGIITEQDLNFLGFNWSISCER